MIDISKLTDEDYKNRILLKKVSAHDLDEIVRINSDLKNIKSTIESLNHESKNVAKQFKSAPEESRIRAKEIKTSLEELSETKNSLEEDLRELSSVIPNPPSNEVPIGEDENSNVVQEYILTPKTFSFPVRDHVDILNLDFDVSTKISKSRFSILRNSTAKLERALINYMLDYNTKANYEEVSLPYLVNENAMYGTGQLPKFKEDLFESDGLYLIPTAEVPLTNMYNDTIIPKAELPIKLTSHTACFRKEAGSGGKDIKGLIRQHQFHKVELVTICEPKDSGAILLEMVSHVSNMLTELELPHRIVKLCTGDLGFSASITYDIEVWIPSQNTYREISSISNTEDFQARRAKIRYKDTDGNKLVHTLNGSSLAVGRTLVALVENFQTEEGYDMPEVLKKYL